MDAELERSLIPAVFGLLGVFVGGLITAGVEWWKMSRAEKRESVLADLEVRQAARLVYGEALFTRMLVKRISQTRHLEEFTMLRLSGWQKYRDLLAKRMSFVDYQRVAGLFTTAEHFIVLGQRNFLLDDSSYEVMPKLLENARAVCKILRRVAVTSEEEDAALSMPKFTHMFLLPEPLNKAPEDAQTTSPAQADRTASGK